jgi:phospholipase D1/2
VKRVATESAPESQPSTANGWLVPGRNCWRVERAERFRCVQDAEEYFRLVRDAILRAQESVFIVGWDILAAVDLVPGTNDGRGPTRLAALLDFVVRRNRNLHVYVLIWDYAAVYALERDPFSRIKLGWATHRRVHFRYDDQHPLAGSHHQKVVVVDDRLAFSGGLDLTGHRWDTPAHEVENALRTSGKGQPYTPFHDVQALMEGPVARSLGELVRERWRRSRRRLARGQRLPAVAPSTESLWPDDVEADFTDVDVVIARTEPELGRRPAVRECEALYLDSIASARVSIYVENQYFTSMRIARALAKRLREPDGPEVVIVGPKTCSGWLEEKTMGVLRQEVLTELVRSDRHGRLRLVHALASRDPEVCTFIHSKIMVIDDEVLRIGSANLSNRSMGVDTECDVAVVANGDARYRAGVRRVRDRLMAEHLGADAADIRRAVERTGSLRGAVDGFKGRARTLEPIEVSIDEKAELAELVREAADPHEPMLLTRTVDRLLPEIDTSNEFARVAMMALPLCVIVAAWMALERTDHPFSTFGHGGLSALLANAPHSPDFVRWTLLLSIAGGLFFVPLEVSALVAVVLLGPFLGGALALAASLIAAGIGYACGRALGPQRVIPLIGRRAYRVWGGLPDRGAVAVGVLRMISVFSAASIHLLCGAARVPFRAYAIGTAGAFVPVVLVLSLMGGMLRHAIRRPSDWNTTFTIVVAVLLAGVVLRARRNLLVKRLHVARAEQEARAVYG